MGIQVFWARDEYNGARNAILTNLDPRSVHYIMSPTNMSACIPNTQYTILWLRPNIEYQYQYHYSMSTINNSIHTTPYYTKGQHNMHCS